MAWQRKLTPNSIEDQAISDQAALDAEMEWATLSNGKEIRFFSTGEGETILFVPMIRELNFVYAPQIAAFAADHRIVLYEPHLSRSVRVGIYNRAKQTRDLMDALEIESAHIVAWSDSGAGAYIFAKEWPKRCRSLTLLGLADRYTLPIPLNFLSNILRHLPVERFIPSFALAQILARFLGGPRISPAAVASHASRISGLARLFKHSIQPQLYQHLPSFNEVLVPSLVVIGDQDALVTVEQAYRMASLLPNARETAIVRGGEHFLGYAHPEIVNELMKSFFCELRNRASGEDVVCG